MESINSSIAESEVENKKVYVSKDRFYDFNVDMTNDLENDFTIYGAANLMYVNNMETLNVSHISIGGAEKLIEVNVSESEHIKGLELGQNKYLQRVICNDCERLGEEERDRHLNLSGCENLKEVDCSNTQIATLSLPETGGVLEVLKCDKLVVVGDLYYIGPRNKMIEGYDIKYVQEFLSSFKDKS